MNKLARFNTYLLDIGDTLVHIAEPFEKYTKRAISNLYKYFYCQLSVSEAKFIEEVYALRVAIRKQAHDSLLEKNIHDFFKEALSKYDIEYKKDVAAEQTYINAELEITEVFDDSKGFLEKLKEKKGKKIYAATNNFSELHVQKVLEKFDLLKYFDGLYISGVTGIRKPSVDFLNDLTNKFSLDKQDCIMIGDKPQMDVLAANRSGVKSVWLKKKNYDLGNEIKPDFVVSNLLEIK